MILNNIDSDFKEQKTGKQANKQKVCCNLNQYVLFTELKSKMSSSSLNNTTPK